MNPPIVTPPLYGQYHTPIVQPQREPEFTVFGAFWEIISPSTEGLSLGDRVSLFFEAVQRSMANLVSRIFGETVKPEEKKPEGFPSPELIGRYGMQARRPKIPEKEVLDIKEAHQALLTVVFAEADPIYSDLVTQLIGSGLSDADIDEICRNKFNALRTEHEQAEAVATFERTLTLFLNENRYSALLKQIHGNNPLVVMEKINTSTDGNCFFDACSKALRLVTGGTVNVSQERLRKDVAAEFDRVLTDPTRRKERTDFYNYFIGGVTGLGNVIPVLSEWEELLQGKTPGDPYAILEWAPGKLQKEIGDLSLADTLNKPLDAAKAFHSALRKELSCTIDWELKFVEIYGLEKLKNSTPNLIAKAMQDIHLREFRDTFKLAKKFQDSLRTHLNYTLDETERELFYRHDLTWILDSKNELALLDEMATLGVGANLEQKAKNLRIRLNNITTLYKQKLESDGTWNGFYESSLTSAVIGRAIVTLEKREGEWLFIDSLTGKEYLPTLAELATNPPLTLGRVDLNHYVTLRYPPTVM